MNQKQRVRAFRPFRTRELVGMYDMQHPEWKGAGKARMTRDMQHKGINPNNEQASAYLQGRW